MNLTTFEGKVNKAIEALEDVAVMSLNYSKLSDSRISDIREALTVLVDLASTKVRYCDMVLMAREEAKKELETTI